MDGQQGHESSGSSASTISISPHESSPCGCAPSLYEPVERVIAELVVDEIVTAELVVDERVMAW